MQSQAAITQQVSVHVLRQCVAPHSLEKGYDVWMIQELLRNTFLRAAMT